MNLSPEYTLDDWNAAFAGTPDWGKAIDIVEDRIEGRWLRWIDEICKHRFSGFAVLALDCIVLESMWGFMHGEAAPRRGEQQVYRDILTGSAFGWSAAQSEDFRLFVRNGVMHDAETRSGWVVEKMIPKDAIVKQNARGQYVLNRTKFHEALRSVFEAWIEKLRAGDEDLRKNMRNRMKKIIEKS